MAICSFSLYRQRKSNQKESSLHAPMQKESQLWELGCGTRFAQTGPRPIFDAVLSRCIPLLHLSLSQHYSVNGYCLLFIGYCFWLSRYCNIIQLMVIVYCLLVIVSDSLAIATLFSYCLLVIGYCLLFLTLPLSQQLSIISDDFCHDWLRLLPPRIIINLLRSNILFFTLHSSLILLLRFSLF